MRRFKHWLFVTTAAILACTHISAVQAGSNDELQPYTATYSVGIDGEILGTALRQLEKDDYGIWTLKMRSHAQYMFYSLEHEERTIFTSDSTSQTNDTEAGRESEETGQTSESTPRPTIRPIKYIYLDRRSLRKDKMMQQTFDWQNMQEQGKRDDRSWVLPLQSNTFDRLSHQLQLRQDLLDGGKTFRYRISYKGRLKTFVYEVMGKEDVKTALGTVSTVKLRQTGESSGRARYFWLAEKFDYFPVKIEQITDGESQGVLLLESLRKDGIEQLAFDSSHSKPVVR